MHQRPLGSQEKSEVIGLGLRIHTAHKAKRTAKVSWVPMPKASCIPPWITLRLLAYRHCKEAGRIQRLGWGWQQRLDIASERS